MYCYLLLICFSVNWKVQFLFILLHILQHTSIWHVWHNDQGHLSIHTHPNQWHHIGMLKWDHGGHLFQQLLLITCKWQGYTIVNYTTIRATEWLEILPLQVFIATISLPPLLLRYPRYTNPDSPVKREVNDSAMQHIVYTSLYYIPCPTTLEICIQVLEIILWLLVSSTLSCNTRFGWWCSSTRSPLYTKGVNTYNLACASSIAMVIVGSLYLDVHLIW